ncbi:MAG: hypothetical protein LBD18_06830 [Treponema sp.]|jgi:hypothetical protein|nr:hypothetical protein [Treponema sp.]
MVNKEFAPVDTVDIVFNLSHDWFKGIDPQMMIMDLWKSEWGSLFTLPKKMTDTPCVALWIFINPSFWKYDVFSEYTPFSSVKSPHEPATLILYRKKK